MRMRSVAVIAALVGAIGFAKAQQPLSLDLSFRAQFDDWQVTSILPLEDGDVIISGQIKFAGDEYFRSGARLNNDGSRALGFAEVTYMGGKLTQWEDKVYAQNAIGVRRLYTDGSLDETFNMVNAPYFLALQGGDYHVYPDGRILMSGVHQVNYPDSNWVGFYNLIWFSSEGYLDTTRAPRMGDGVIYRFKELPDGKFICTGPMSQYDGHPTSAIFRVHADGRLDTTFITGVTWGQAACFLPLDDGRCYAGGLFRINGISDTLNLVRFLPDGSLDPTFNNGHAFIAPPPITSMFVRGVVAGITPLDAGRLVVTGTFRNVDGIQRGSICLIDTAGQLLDDHFSAGGCGPHTYQGFTDAAIQDIIITDSVCYIWGDYHGYNDGTTNDPLQRFVTRLYGPDFSTRVMENADVVTTTLSILPNPAWSSTAITLGGTPTEFLGALVLRDLTGRSLAKQVVKGPGTEWVMDVGSIPSGTYLITLLDAHGTQLTTERLVVQH
jgi:uncharacterized delta-60 repeat protein